MKFLLPLALFVAFAFSACNTLENRRSFYSNEKVHGPYTRELAEGNWGNPQTVDQQYDQTRRESRRPKLIQPKATPSSSGSGTSMPSAGADAVPL